jgi:hypothetical protein
MGGHIGKYPQKHDFSFLMQIRKNKSFWKNSCEGKELRNNYGAD